MNSSQELEQHNKIMIHKNEQAIPQSDSLGEGDRYKDNLCICTTRIIPSKGSHKVSKQNILSLRHSEAYKQKDKQTI